MLERFGFGRVVARAPRVARHAYAVLVVMVGWVFFRAETLPHALAYLGQMADPRRFGAPDAALAILLDAQTLAALALGSLLAAPVLPWVLRRLRVARAEPPLAGVPERLDTRSVHALPVAVLAGGFVLSIAILVGSTLNPFLYFRF